MNTIFPAPKHKLIGHRGVAGLRPENTYCSFSLAAELGLNWIEFDVFLTKDQQWIVIHDDTLERTTNGHGLVRQHTTEELSQLQAGLWFKPPYPNQPLPTLLGTLELAKKLQLFCNVEIKGAENDPQHHAKLICQFITQHADLTQGNVMLSSFDLPCLIAIRKIMPDIPVGYLVENFSHDTIDITKKHNFNSINADVDKMHIEALTAATAEKIPVFLYTIDDPATAKFWLQHGISGLFTNYADLLLTT